tara:strand:- start:2356 stop:2850 length:495 start_codon:yes stop_codon:yes gene_type:complete
MSHKTIEITLNNILGKDFRFTSNLKNNITDEVIKKLGLKTKFQLNDRYEGISFLDKHVRRVLSCKLIEEFLNINLCSKEKSLKCITNFEYEEKNIIVVTSNKMNIVNFTNMKFDYLLLVSFRDNYKLGFLKKIISLNDLIKKGIINDKNIGNKKLLSFNLSSLQ